MNKQLFAKHCRERMHDRLMEMKEICKLAADNGRDTFTDYEKSELDRLDAEVRKMRSVATRFEKTND